MDQPFRNISNFDWIIASLEYSIRIGSRIELHGGAGNGTISWEGHPLRNQLSNFVRSLYKWVFTDKIFTSYFENHNPSFLKAPSSKRILRKRGINWILMGALVANPIYTNRNTSTRTLSYWYGVERLDATQDLKIVEFCQSIPDHIFHTGSVAKWIIFFMARHF